MKLSLKQLNEALDRMEQLAKEQQELAFTAKGALKAVLGSVDKWCGNCRAEVGNGHICDNCDFCGTSVDTEPKTVPKKN